MRDYSGGGPPPRPPSLGPLCRGEVIRVQESSPDLTTGPRAAPPAGHDRDARRNAPRLCAARAAGPRQRHRARSIRSPWTAHSGSRWRSALANEMRRFSVFDCRGHGASDKPPGPYTVELFADDLADLLDHVGWSTALVAGASMGGCVALAFAARLSRAHGGARPDRHHGLVRRRGAEATGRSAREPGGREGTSRRWSSSRPRAGSATTFRAKQPGRRAAMRRHVPDATTCRPMSRPATCSAAADLRAALPTLKMPTAVVVGEEDYAAPVAMAQALHRRRSRARP